MTILVTGGTGFIGEGRFIRRKYKGGREFRLFLAAGEKKGRSSCKGNQFLHNRLNITKIVIRVVTVRRVVRRGTLEEGQLKAKADGSLHGRQIGVFLLQFHFSVPYG